MFFKSAAVGAERWRLAFSRRFFVRSMGAWAVRACEEIESVHALRSTRRPGASLRHRRAYGGRLRGGNRGAASVFELLDGAAVGAARIA